MASSCFLVTEAALTAKTVVDTFDSATTQTQTLQGLANLLNAASGPLSLLGQGPLPPLVTGLAGIANTFNGAAPQFQGTPKFTAKSDQDAMVGAFSKFVTVQDQMQSTLSSLESQLEALNPQTEVGKALLKGLESLVEGADTFAEGMMSTLPSGSPAAQIAATQRQALDAAVGMTVSKLSGR